jgi:hypothetical protein
MLLTLAIHIKCWLIIQQGQTAICRKSEAYDSNNFAISTPASDMAAYIDLLCCLDETVRSADPQSKETCRISKLFYKT